jgi:hypothetical protein
MSRPSTEPAFIPGRYFRQPTPPEKRPLRQLNPVELETIAQTKALVHAHMPELVPIIKELHECGLIDGWRNVGEVVLFKDGAQ